jgi:hypothetical protein
MREIGLAIAGVMLCLIFASSSYAESPDLATADWSVHSPNSLVANPPSEDAALALLNRLLGGVFPYICSSRFVDLRHSGNLSLIVSASDGRHCGFLNVIDKTPSGFELYEPNQDAEVEEIKDLAADGKHELILDTWNQSEPGQGGLCLSPWPAIFAWTGSGYANVSDQYKGYYEHHLDSLKKQMAAEEAPTPAAIQTPTLAQVTIGPLLRQNSDGATIEDQALGLAPSTAPTASTDPIPTVTRNRRMLGLRTDPFCMAAEAAKIERFLGLTDAAMNDAVKLAGSEDPQRRELAVCTLVGLGTPEAIEHLRALTDDSNEKVSSLAKDVQAGREEPVVPEFEREEVQQLTPP